MSEIQTTPGGFKLTLPRTKKEPLLFVFYIAYAFLFIHLTPLKHMGLLLPLFALSGVGALILYRSACGKRLDLKSVVLLLPVAVLSLSYAFFENSLIEGPLFLALLAFTAFFAAFDAPVAPWRVLSACGLVAVKPFCALAQKAAALIGDGANRRKWLYVLMGAVLAVPLLLVLTSLLMDADALFESTMKQFFDRFLNMEDMVAKVGFALLGGAWLYSLSLSAVWEKREQGALANRFSVHQTALISLLVPVLVLYAVFFAIKAVGFIQAAGGAPLSAGDLSAYARDGFMELCAVAVINLSLFLGTRALSRDKTTALKGCLLILSALTEMIIALSVYKMLMYMNAYGLTLLRVYTMWFMISLAVLFVFLLVNCVKAFPVFKWAAALVAASIMAVSMANVGGMVAKTNGDRYLSGSLAAFDMTQYGNFFYESAPALIDLYQRTDDEMLKETLYSFLLDGRESADRSALNQSLQEMNARHAVEAFLTNEPAPRQ